MKVSVEKLPTSEAVLEVDLTWDELEKASNKAYSKLVQQVDIPGFRRGKAPRSLLERKVGKEYIYQEGLDELISEAYRTAIKEHELTPIKQPELEAPVFEIGQPYHFSLKVPILAPVELGDYSSLHFDRDEANVTSEEVENELEALRNRQATWVEVERPANYDDRVTMDLKLTVEDKVISDLKDNPFELTQERHGLFVGLDENIVGMQTGDSKEFSVTLPADYTNEKLAGKEAHYVVHLYKVEVKEVPELDDAFAEKASDGQLETLEDVRKAVSDSILENKKRKIRDELREKVVNAVIEQSQVTIHPVLVDEEAEAMMHQMEHLLQQQRMSMDQYLMLMRKNREEYLNDIRPDAENRVKRQLVLDAVARKEEISVQPEELEALFRAYAQAGQPLDQSEEQIQSLFITYRREKTVTQLVELTTDPDPDEELAEEISMENAEAAALAGDPDTADVTETIATIDTSTGETTNTTGTFEIGETRETEESGRSGEPDNTETNA
ncbi:MAG: trigger factor [Chloroflexota bacterium]|nr:trigger factor [Chloroflexota bacterium]